MPAKGWVKVRTMVYKGVTGNNLRENLRKRFKGKPEERNLRETSEKPDRSLGKLSGEKQEGIEKVMTIRTGYGMITSLFLKKYNASKKA